MWLKFRPTDLDNCVLWGLPKDYDKDKNIWWCENGTFLKHRIHRWIYRLEKKIRG
mgnify:CR=1 FL=1